MMDMTRYCDGCRVLAYDQWSNYYTAHCCDKDKPVTGPCRVVAVSEVARPIYIPRPAWCRGKKE